MAYYGVKKKVFDPKSVAPHRLSRSKIDLFVECPRCFYMDQRLGIGRPSTFPLTLNIAVDELLKKEFDILRESQNPHPIMEKYRVDAVPFKHPDLLIWRDALRRGIEYLDPRTNLSIRGGVDDIWVRPNGELIVVDYKAKATREEITLEGDLGLQYKRQAEVYQWLFRKNGFKVSPTAYFVFVNANKDMDTFDGRLEFDMILVPCEGNTEWVEEIIPKIKECLMGDILPLPDPECEYCAYRKSAAEAASQNKVVSDASGINKEKKDEKSQEKEISNKKLF